MQQYVIFVITFFYSDYNYSVVYKWIVICIQSIFFTIFDDRMNHRVLEIFIHIASNYNITLEEWNHDVDHVHILFSFHADSQALEITVMESKLSFDQYAAKNLREKRKQILESI